MTRAKISAAVAENVNRTQKSDLIDREIKDEEGRNSPEVNKQLNDEKQSMVSSFKHIQYASCLIDTKKLLGIIVRALQGIKI